MNGNDPLPHMVADPHRDTKAMNAIALTLGRPASWDGVGDYLDEISHVIAATGRPHPGAVFGSAGGEWFRAALRDFSVAPDTAGGGWAVADGDTLNRIAAHLGSGAQWGPDDLEHVAQMVSDSGRPHPGASDGRTYEAALERWMSGALAADGLDEPTGTLLIKVDDIDRFDNPQEPWTAQAFWQTDDGLSDGVGVGGGASIPAALHALAHDMEAGGVLYAPAPPSVPEPGWMANGGSQGQVVGL